MRDFFANMTLQVKILTIGVGFPAVIIAGLLMLYSQQANQNAVVSSADKARSLCSTAEAAREHAERQWKDEIISQKQIRQWGEEGQQEKLLSAVPIIAAWEIAMSKSEEGGYEVRTPALEPRNTGNTPNEIQREALLALKNDRLEEYVKVDHDANTVHYFRPIRLAESCLICHGDPASSVELWGTNDGTDVTGYRMENWSVGDMHGAFEVVQSLDAATAEANASIFWGILIAGFAMAVTGVITVLALRSVKARILGASSVISESVHGLVDTSDQLKADAGDAYTKAQAMATSVEETTQNIDCVNDAMQNMRQASDEIAARSTEATMVAQTAVTKVEGTVEVISDLEKNSSRINNVVGLINSLAEQTNLLALNATIEAARAGEYGKGFAVVATEVKELANQTALATSEIAEVVGSIQAGTQESIKSVEEIHTVIGQISEAQTSIAAAVEEQNATTGEISRNLGDIADSSRALSDDINVVSGSSERTNDRVAESSRLITEITTASHEIPRLVGIETSDQRSNDESPVLAC